MIWKKYEKLTANPPPPHALKNTFPEVFRLKLSFLHLLSNVLSRTIINIDCGIVINFCVVYLVKAPSHLISSNAT